VESEGLEEEECQNKENEAPKAVSFNFAPAQAARKAVAEGL
jgi:ferredoxin-NADP reductase